MRSEVLAVALLLGLVGCGHDHPSSGAATKSTCPSGSSLTYQSFGKQFLQDFCGRCHASTVKGAARQGAPEDHTFDTVEQIADEKEHLDMSAAAGPAAVNTGMPPSNPMPTEAQRRQLGEWLACGAK
jgi:uncharacterized membrane protein